MANIDTLLLWEKWRPKTIEDIILLPRISKRFEDGIKQHYIFYGHFGTGKTSLAKILIGEYSKKTPYLSLDCSNDTSVELLRDGGIISKFCKTVPIFEADYDMKYVFLDEFERTSPQFQDALKAFIEKYNSKVRFIMVTNHINKVSDGLKSRIKLINFDCENIEEEKFLKIEIYKRIKNIILPEEGKDIEKKDLVQIVNKKFPDFRSIIVEVQDTLQTGNKPSDLAQITTDKARLELYEVIYDKSLNYENIYHFLMDKFGPEKIDDLVKMLGKEFIDWSITNNKNIDKLFNCNYIISDYSNKLESSTDPLVLGMTIVGKFRDILIS